MTTPRWQDSIEWKAAETAARDWIEAQSAEPSVAVYFAAKTAVAADRRQLREQIAALKMDLDYLSDDPADDYWNVALDDVLDLLRGES